MHPFHEDEQHSRGDHQHPGSDHVTTISEPDIVHGLNVDAECKCDRYRIELSVEERDYARGNELEYVHDRGPGHDRCRKLYSRCHKQRSVCSVHGDEQRSHGDHQHANSDHRAANNYPDIVYRSVLEFECDGHGHRVELSMAERRNRHKRSDLWYI